MTNNDYGTSTLVGGLLVPIYRASFEISNKPFLPSSAKIISSYGTRIGRDKRNLCTVQRIRRNFDFPEAGCRTVAMKIPALMLEAKGRRLLAAQVRSLGPRLLQRGARALSDGIVYPEEGAVISIIHRDRGCRQGFTFFFFR